jgi:glycine C-acetyltransferase
LSDPAQTLGRFVCFPRCSFFAAAAPQKTAFKKVLQTELEGIKAAGTYKRERIITSSQNAQIRVQEAAKPVLNFCANNYLGLSDHKELVGAAHRALDSHGLGLSSVRFICGTQDIHKTLEKKIADFHGMEDSILYPSCFDANAGIFEALLTAEDAIITDSLNHASIIDGVRLSKAKRFIYQHIDMTDLETKLKEAQSARIRMIVTDGVFSMDGHIAPLKAVCDLADKYDAYVFIDECHATGFFGKTGRGTPDYCGVEGRIDIINSTLGKALGGATGGYTAASREVVDLLRQRSRPYLFSNTVAPAVVGASIKCFDMIANDTTLRDKLEANTQQFRSGLEAAGFDLGGSKDHPIVPIMLGDARLAAEFSEEMLKRGIYVVGFSFPVVPKGKARIRTQISASHSTAHIKQALDAFIEVGRLKGVIPQK